jgi:paraquat-inducible protein B
MGSRRVMNDTQPTGPEDDALRPGPANGTPGQDSDAAALRPRRLSWVWLIPIASVAIGLWLVWTTLARQGPLIDVSFDSAEGLQAGQSQVKYKDMPMGTVESFDLSSDRTKVVMHIRMMSKADPLLTEGAQFWIVKPGVFAGDITGLNTILSGSYISMEPGQPGKPGLRQFAGMEHPPALEPGYAGRHFRLTAPRLGALSVGSPVFFRDVDVGKVIDWTLAKDASSVTLNVFVNRPYDAWVHDDSRFWNTSGITAKLVPSGVQLQVDSLKAALLGGVTFDTPQPTNQALASKDDHEFALYPNAELAEAGTAQRRVELATYLTGSVGGLEAGAPVMLMGLRIGDVTSVQLQFDTDTNQPRVRVGFIVQVGMVQPVGRKPAAQFPGGWDILVKQGLRTSLQGGNLITGGKQLSLTIDPDAAPAALGHEGGTLIIPSSGTSGGGLDDVASSATALLKKINQMPFAQIGDNLNGALKGINDIVNGPQLKQAVSRLNDTLAEAQETVRHLDQGAAPALKRLPAISAELQAALTQVKTLAGSVSSGSASDSKFARDLDEVLVQVSDTAQSVRMVADLLARHPEALIRGRTGRAAE